MKCDFYKKDGCIKCGRTDKWSMGFKVIDKMTGKKCIALICFECLAKQAEKGGEQE